MADTSDDAEKDQVNAGPTVLKLADHARSASSVASAPEVLATEAFAEKIADSSEARSVSKLNALELARGGSRATEASTMLKNLYPSAEFATQLGLLPSMVDQLHTPMLQSALSAASILSTPEASRAVRALSLDSAAVAAYRDAHTNLVTAARPYGGIAKMFQDSQLRYRQAAEALQRAFPSSVAELSGVAHWSRALASIEKPDVMRLFGPTLGPSLDEMRSVAAASRAFETLAIDRERMNAILGLSTRFGVDFQVTQLRMSALTGVSETLGTRDDLHSEAYRALFGEWRTRPDLPEDFWRDRRVRKQMYRDAEVDDGLVVATPEAALDVMIDSGLTVGMRSEEESRAVVTLGEVSVTITSRSASKDAYAILANLEAEMRAYVTQKLEAHVGVDWFKLRASNLFGNAKRIRKQALERGEGFAPLINFIDLGDLGHVILQRQNWDEVFGPVFTNRDEFRYDMEKLVAARRPTMHIRQIDGLRLVELVCVTQRLIRKMADDGAWRIEAQSDL